MSLPNTNVGAFDARTRFFELLERIEAGEEVTIMRHGKAVARIVPPIVAAQRAEQQRADAEPLAICRTGPELTQLARA